MRYFVQDNGDGTFSLVEEYAPGGFTTVATGSQNEMENLYNQMAGGGTQIGAGETMTGTYETREGPKTEEQIRNELSAAGYGGPWDIKSMLAAYEGAGGGGGTYDVLPAQTPYLVQMAIAEMENALAEATLALQERRFEEYDLIMLELQQSESALSERLAEAGVTGYLEGQPTLDREQWEAAIQSQQEQYQLQQDQANEQIRQFDTMAAQSHAEAEEARRQYNESLAFQKEVEARQYELQSTQLQAQLAYQEATITGFYEGAQTMERQVMEQQYELAVENMNLARWEAQEAVRMGDETLAFQKEAELRQYELQSQQLQQQAQQWEQEYGLAEAGVTGTYEGQPTMAYQQYEEQARQFDIMAEQAHWEAQEAVRQGDEQLAWQKEQEARYYENRAMEFRTETTGMYEGEPTFAREQWQAEQDWREQEYEMEMMRSPGDWITYLAQRRGGLTEEMVPPTSQAIFAGEPLPALAGITPAPRIGTGETAGMYPYEQPSTMRIPSTQAWYGMTPGEQEAHQAVVELGGVPWREYEAEFERQAPGEPYPEMAWR